MPSIMDFNPFEKWSAEGAKDHDQRGREKAKAMLNDYVAPVMDQAKAEALKDFVARRERELPDVMV